VSEPGVHPLSVVAPGARLGSSVSIGPFAVIGANVVLGDGVIIHPHAVVDGHTTLGSGAEVYPFAAIGLRPQSLKYDGTPTRLEIGARTVMRECVTIQPGSSGPGLGLTKVGPECFIMAYSHIGHDCTLGQGVIIANASQIAGHCEIGDFAILGGVTTVHQFVRIGTRAITGASARVQQDVPPFMMADGHPARLFGLNTVGLKRARFAPDTMAALKHTYKRIFLLGPYSDAIKDMESTLGKESAEVAELCRFLRESRRGVTRAAAKKPPRTREGSDS
jgi:UDP-N-acetylglucosamine acyltransferase